MSSVFFLYISRTTKTRRSSPQPPLSAMEDELKNLAKVTILVSASMTYARFASARIPPGRCRLLALSPVLLLLPFLPLYFASIHLRGTSSFFLVWLAPFRLLLLSFAAGPLATPLPLLSFIASSTLPVRIKAPGTADPHLPSPRRFRFPFLSAAKVLLLSALLPVYRLKASVHPYLMLVVYSMHVYLNLDLIFSSTRTAVAILLPGLELEPQFENPFLATSLGDFWGRRWNLVVSAVLRPSVYVPVRSRLGPAAGVLAAFLVSGFMHEVMFCYITWEPPTGEVTAFFALHGACVVAERMAKRAGAWRPPQAVSVLLTLGFVAATSFWLFFPPLLRNNSDERSLAECVAAMQYVNRTGGLLLARFGLL